MHNVSPHVFVSLCHKFKVIIWQQNYERFLRNCIVPLLCSKLSQWGMGRFCITTWDRETLKLCNTKRIMPLPSSILLVGCKLILQLFIPAFLCMGRSICIKKRKSREKLDRFLWFFSKTCKQTSVRCTIFFSPCSSWNFLLKYRQDLPFTVTFWYEYETGEGREVSD